MPSEARSRTARFRPVNQCLSLGEVATSFTVSRRTARRAMQVLVDERMVWLVPGLGYFVCESVMNGRAGATRGSLAADSDPEHGPDIGPTPRPYVSGWTMGSYLELGALPSAVPSARLHARLVRR